nr:hypothetical protein [Tanacetum cinerariifolium]
MRVASINGKRYVLVIVDDYSRYTWTHFLKSKDETPEVLIDFLRLVQRGLQAQVRVVRTDKGTEFLNQTLHAYFAAEGIQHQTSVARTPEQNDAEGIATACFTQNRSLVIPRHEKTPYHIINERKPSVKFFHIFGSICYIVRDGENLDKMKEKGDECIFVGYSTQSRAYRVFNKRTRRMASVQISSDPAPECQTMALEHDSLSPGRNCQENVSHGDKTGTTSNELDLLFSPMFDELLNGSTKVVSKSSARGLQAQVRVVRTDKGTEFLNQTLHAYLAAEGIQHQTSVARTPEQNGVVEKRNRTLVEAARTMISAAKVPLFFWAEAIATTCFTQNRSLVIHRHKKTPYHIINERKPSVKFFHIFGSVCYIVRDGKNLDKMKEKGDECIFVGYSTQSRAYRVFNKRTRVIMESIHVNFDELPLMASVQNS